MGVDNSTLHAHCVNAGGVLSSVADDNNLIRHGEGALVAFDQISVLISGDDDDIKGLLSDARAELLDAYMASVAERTNVAFILLRGVMEGIFSALFYRQQKMSLNLWASGASFHMVHQFLSDKHEFYMYYKRLFEDDRFSTDYPGLKFKKIIDEAISLYDMLSASVHKKSPSSKSKFSQDFSTAVERVFRISICLLEREEDIPLVSFPSPPSYASYELSQKSKKGENRDR